MTFSAETLAGLVFPTSAEDFFNDYWEKTYLHQSGDPQRFRQYFSLADVDRWITSARTQLPDAIVIASPEGAEVERKAFGVRDLSVDNAYLAFAKGSSLVLNYMQDWPSIAELSKGLSRDFYADVGVNAYLTPANARTFPIHTDEHDVLVLHLEGEKTWHLHDFSLLQVGLTQKKNFKFPQDWYGRTETPELAEIRLKPGDLLYIPRGMPHYARANDGTCLHLTISITPLYWFNFLKVAAEYAALHSQDLRRALNPGFMESEDVREDLREAFPGIMRAFTESVDFDDILAAVRRNRADFQHFPSDGHFRHLDGINDLTIEQRVERRRDVLCTIDEVFDVKRNRKLALLFGNQKLAGPFHLRGAFEFISGTRFFKISEIPGLDEKGQLVLAKRLVLEGLLRPVADDESLLHGA